MNKLFPAYLAFYFCRTPALLVIILSLDTSKGLEGHIPSSSSKRPSPIARFVYFWDIASVASRPAWKWWSFIDWWIISFHSQHYHKEFVNEFAIIAAHGLINSIQAPTRCEISRWIENSHFPITWAFSSSVRYRDCAFPFCVRPLSLFVMLG